LIPVIDGLNGDAKEILKRVQDDDLRARFTKPEDKISVTCPSTFPHQTQQDSTATDATTHSSLTQITTKFTQKCSIIYTYFFPYEGTSPNGIPQNFTTFQTQIIDHAGNVSGRNQSLTIYRDTQSPTTPNVQNISSASYNPVKGWTTDAGSQAGSQAGSNAGSQAGSQGIPLQRPITKDTTITTTFAAERLSDLLISTSRTVNTKATETTTTQLIRNGSNSPDKTQQQSARNYALSSTFGQGEINSDKILKQVQDDGGAQRDDVNAACIQTSNSPIANRKLGTCNDGVYSFNSIVATDTSGNSSSPGSSLVERDTVVPGTATLITQPIEAKGYVRRETMGITIQNAEAKTKAIISISASNGEKYTIFKTIPDNGTFSTENLLSKPLTCGEITYTTTVKLEDRAGNIGESSKPSSFTTKTCPTCGGFVEGGSILSPLRDSRAQIDWFFKESRYTDHTGVDFNLRGVEDFGTPIYASAAGTVTYTGSNQSAWYFGNYIVIDHGSGFSTLYAHLSAIHVKAGDFVDNQTIIGLMGSTGNSSGSHLHFETRINNIPVDPLKFLTTDNVTGNLTPEERTTFGCDGEGGGEGDNYNEHPTKPHTEAKNKIAKYIADNFGGDTQIQRNDPMLTTITKQRTLELHQKPPLSAQGAIEKVLTLQKACNVWYQEVNYTSNTNNSWLADDGALFLNPYNNNVYFVKNEIWKKYKSVNMSCHAVGVPQWEEQTSPTQAQSVASAGELQSFRNTNFNKNVMHTYWHKNEGRKTYYTVNKVAEQYNANGETNGIYGYPTGNTSNKQTQSYCWQKFENGREVDLCPALPEVEIRDNWIEHGYSYVVADIRTSKGRATLTGENTFGGNIDFLLVPFYEDGTTYLEGSNPIGVNISTVAEEGFLNESAITSYSLNMPGATFNTDGKTGNLNVNGGGVDSCPEDFLNLKVCAKQYAGAGLLNLEVNFDLDYNFLDLENTQNPITIELKGLEEQGGNIIIVMDVPNSDYSDLSFHYKANNSMNYDSLITASGSHKIEYTQRVPAAVAYNLAPRKVNIEAPAQNQAETQVNGWLPFPPPDWARNALIALVVIILVAVIIALAVIAIGPATVGAAIAAAVSAILAGLAAIFGALASLIAGIFTSTVFQASAAAIIGTLFGINLASGDGGT